MSFWYTRDLSTARASYFWSLIISSHLLALQSIMGFRISRQMLCGFLALTATGSATLGAASAEYFDPQQRIWFIVAVGVLSALRAIWSWGILRPVVHSPQSVAVEAVSLFVIFPFQLFAALLASSMTTRHETYASALAGLKIFATGGAILHVTYTVILISVALLTVTAFDSDVWMRDIDSAPSPFPLGILFAYFCPCLARRFPATRSLVIHELVPQERLQPLCLPICDPVCRVHEHSKMTTFDAGGNRPSPTSRRIPPVLPHALIRIPNSAELRAAIHVELPVRSL